MDILYSTEKVHDQCTNLKAAQKLFGGDRPLDENEEPYNPCNIDEISGKVRIVEIREVSKHYE